VALTPKTSCASSSPCTRGVPHATVFDLELIEERSGLLIFRALGDRAAKDFADEGGGHRWQRVPPMEKRGRVQTSTVTVAILEEPTPLQVRMDDRDLEWQTCRASGAGGQKVNKTDSAVQLRHRPSGLMVRVETERSQHQNRATAHALLAARLWERERQRVQNERDASRRDQVGAGQRGDKRRTIAVQRGTVVDHVTGRTWDLRRYMRGDW
jgi:peptide chain release factor 1